MGNACDQDLRPVGQPSHLDTYDGNGLRVMKVSGNTTTIYLFSGSKVIAEYLNGAAPSSPSREYIYLAGALLASVANGAVTYYHQDHLSNRLATNSSGAATEQLGNFPFGESWYTATGEKWLFTSYERDSESNNDYAQARYYVNRFGRFLSADPLSGSVADPQSLNRYAYVENDPINAADPSGLKMMPPLAWLGLQLFYGGIPTPSSWDEFMLLAIPVAIGSYSRDVWVGGDPTVFPTFNINNVQFSSAVTGPETLTITATVLTGPVLLVPFTPVITAAPPKMQGIQKKRNCSLIGRIGASLDFSFKEGFSLESGILNMEVSRNVDMETNQTTAHASISSFGFGFEAERSLDTGNLNPTLVDPDPQFNFDTPGSKTNLVNWDTTGSGSVTIGGALGVGVDATFNKDKFKAETAACGIK